MKKNYFIPVVFFLACIFMQSCDKKGLVPCDDAFDYDVHPSWLHILAQNNTEIRYIQKYERFIANQQDILFVVFSQGLTLQENRFSIYTCDGELVEENLTLNAFNLIKNNGYLAAYNELEIMQIK